MSYVFYDSLIPAPLLLPVWMIYMRDWHDDISRKKEQELRQQFRDSIQVMASALKAGYSVENAIREAGKDISPVYSEETRIRKEFERMERQMDMNMSAEEVLKGFAERTGQEDIENFVNVFAAAKKSGGDSIAVIRDAVKIISGKIDTEKEIQTMIASKKMEFDIMCAVPFAIILYMKLTFGEFLNVLYGNMAGAAIMSLCIFVYMGAYVYGRKIIRIEV
ncbi:MAG: type II secretion system F family protein [Lachnospiraceae bacterium]|jgi:tight adherence protein B|nr:type II secretion system F family protein [Lachnospiraceae bacterium]HJC79935.1 type II secretion system F family protein [Candidatus Mediterraneibacter excrementipullorum]